MGRIPQELCKKQVLGPWALDARRGYHGGIVNRYPKPALFSMVSGSSQHWYHADERPKKLETIHNDFLTTWIKQLRTRAGKQGAGCITEISARVLRVLET